MLARFLSLAPLILCLAACAADTSKTTGQVKTEEVLIIHADGTMLLNGRIMNKEDVIIYPDGFGGERAAVRVMVPLHPDFFRDTIPVDRIEVPVERRE